MSISDTINNVSEAVNNIPTEKTMSILDLTIKGGWIVGVLFVLSLVAVYFFIVKFIEIKKASKEDPSFMDRIQDYMSDGKINSALKLCDDTNSPYAKMIKKGILHRDKSNSDIRVVIENVGNVEIGKLEGNVGVLATISATAPMIGFLGTVVGMLQSFFNMANAGSSGLNIQVFAGGIYQALVTTVAGLIVGILALFAYNYLTSRLDKVINSMEYKTMEFMDVINKL